MGTLEITCGLQALEDRKMDEGTYIEPLLLAVGKGHVQAKMLTRCDCDDIGMHRMWTYGKHVPS